MTNCVNCGAPLKRCTCDYCGTINGKNYEKEPTYMLNMKMIVNPTREMLCDQRLLVKGTYCE